MAEDVERWEREYMNKRREVLEAINQLTLEERGQLLAYLLLDDHDPFSVIDSSRWRFMDGFSTPGHDPLRATQGRLLERSDIPEGEGRSL